MDIRSVLARHPLFAKLSASNLDSLALTADVLRLDTGDTLTAESTAPCLVTRGSLHALHGTVTQGDLINLDAAPAYALTSCTVFRWPPSAAKMLVGMMQPTQAARPQRQARWANYAAPLAYAVALQGVYAALEIAPWLVISPVIDRCLLYRDFTVWPTLLAALLVLTTFAIGANAIHGTLLTPLASRWATAMRRRTILSIAHSVAAPRVMPANDRWWQRLRTTLRAIDQLQEHGALWVHEACQVGMCLILLACLAGKSTTVCLIALLPLALWRMFSGRMQVHAAHELFVIQLLCTLHGLLVLAVGVQAVRSHEMSIGRLVTVLGLWLNIWDSSMHVLPLRALPAALRRRIGGRAHAATSRMPRARVIFDGVAAAYPGASQPALQAFSLSLAPGDAVGIVGRSGAGKSTVARLLYGVVAPTSGTLTVGNVAVHQWSPAARREHVAWLDDKPFLVTGSISSHLTCGAGTAEMARLAWACEICGIDSDAACNPGTLLRASLARALMRRPKILVLDNFFAALSESASQHLFNAVRAACPDTSVIVMSRTPHALFHLPHIVVLDGGRTVDCGTHAQLLAHRGLYPYLLAEHAA